MTPLAAWLLLTLGGAVAVWSLVWIIRWYRKPYGFPWILSLVFAGAALGTILGLRALIAR